jgi:signal transduction histidine kinase/ABC-type multidrug transport system ATPase subunit
MATALDPVVGQTTSPLLSVSGLTVSFGAVQALAGLDLGITEGELVAVAGEPGAGKTTLVRCIAGDIAPASGEIRLAGQALAADLGAANRRGIAVVWQDLALCDTLDVAGNVMLGRETPRLMLSRSGLHTATAALLNDLGIAIPDTTRLVGSLSLGQRQLVAIAKAVGHRPRLLVLDEPTALLGLAGAAEVEELIARLRAQGTTIMLVGRDVDQMFRLADRIVVLRHGRLVANVDPAVTHPDEVNALLSGQQIDSSARRQLTRLHGLADSLVSAEPSSSLSLILSALGAALGTGLACIHVVTGRSLRCAASLGFAPDQMARLARLPVGAAGGPVGRAAAAGERVVQDDLRRNGSWAGWRELLESAEVASAWSVPVLGSAGVNAVITVFRTQPGPPQRDESDLLTLYAGYAASAVERERLLDQMTARNRVLETIREMLETLAGPVPVADGFGIALGSLCRGLQAEEVALFTPSGEQAPVLRAYAGRESTSEAVSDVLRRAAEQALADPRRDGAARRFDGGRGPRIVGVPFNGPAGPTVLLAAWREPGASDDDTALIEDASHSLRLALEREEAGLAHQEANALRRSRELQRGFLSRLSHELRTPLTAIRGYASSLMQPDVTWDEASQERFLDRIAAESARLGRLVDDLLDFSAIESGVMRLQRDWCEIHLVLEAAVACLPADAASAVTITCGEDLPTIWADHDRLEQVFVNLLNNAILHNAPGTSVRVSARSTAAAPAGEVEIDVSDDGEGFTGERVNGPLPGGHSRPSPTAGAGLGLSIAHGIVDAHGGRLERTPTPTGTTFRIFLPVETPNGGADG